MLQFREDRGAINSFPAIKLLDADLNFSAHFLKLRSAEAILVIEETKPFADNFAGRLVAPTSNFLLYKFFEFWRE